MSDKRLFLAKTTPPTLSGLLPRERLFKMLDEACVGRAVWLTGPPGCGKTTLAASYLEHRDIASLWYQIDESDTDVAAFFYHLGLALPDHGKRKAAHLPTLMPQHRQGLAPFARRYFQTVYRILGSSFLIVFDGYHEVSTQSPLHEVMLAALSELPPGGTAILISRADPPPSMIRLRANRALVVLGWNELRLTAGESDAIAAQRGRKLPRSALLELYEKTQGWAAGLILMLEQATSSSIAAPTDLATPQLVFDYLAGEIFEKTDENTCDFLLSTAYLPHMTADMARTLSGRQDAGDRLAGLYRNNYFVSLKQAQPQLIYEYHPLMREFLVARAHAILSQEHRERLQRSSAALLEAEGMMAEAVLLLRTVGDWERIEGLIRRHARTMLDSGRSETLAQWVESLPGDVQERNPWTLYWLAVARMQASPRESRLLHERAHELFSRHPQPDLHGLLFSCSGAMDAILYELDDFSLLDRWISTMDQTLGEHPDLISGVAEARIACSLHTSMVVRQPQHPEIEYWGERAYRVSASQSDINVRLSVEPRVALGIAYGGHFPRAWSIIEGIRKAIVQHGVSQSALTMLKLVEATYFMLTGQRELCYRAVREGLEIERAEGLSVLAHQLLAYGAGCALTSDDLQTAEEFLHQAEQLPGTPARFDRCLYHLFSTWLAMRRRDTVRAFQQQKLAVKMAIEVGCPVFEVLCRIASAQVHYDNHEVRAALSQFQRVYEIVRHIRNHLIEFTALMAYAYVALDSGSRPRSGMRALRRAFEIGKPRNYVAFPLWQPAPLARLCSVALETGIHPDFAAILIRDRSLSIDAQTSALADWPWRLRVFTLGHFRVVKNGEPITFSGKAQRRPFDLLKVLIAYGGSNVSLERVTEALWPRVDGDSAHRSFTAALHRLRKLLGDDKAILLSEGRLRLNGHQVWTDVWTFEQVVAQISQITRLATRDADAHLERFGELSERLFEYYAGPFLGDDPERSWSLELRDRLRQRFVRAVAEIARRWQQAGKIEQAVHFLERALEVDHTSEVFFRILMECYMRAGSHAEVAETYVRCRKMLATTFQIDPSPETVALYESLTRTP